MNQTAFTQDDIDNMLAVAREQGLPEVIRTEVAGSVVTLVVADKAAVEAWAERLEEQVRDPFGYHGTPFVTFSRHGHTAHVVAAVHGRHTA